MKLSSLLFPLMFCVLLIGPVSFADELTANSIAGLDSIVFVDSLGNVISTTPSAPAKSNSGNRPYVGANVSVRWWNDLFSIGLYPMIGFPLTDEFSAGLKAGFAVTSDARVEPTLKTNHYGGGAFVRYKLIPELYLHGEFASYSIERATQITSAGYVNEREWIPFLFVGAGYAGNIGGDNTFIFEVLFDVLQDDHSPFEGGDPFINVGVVAGF